MHLEGMHTVGAQSVRSVHRECTARCTTNDRTSQSYSPSRYKTCLHQNMSRECVLGVAQTAYGYVYMCKDGYAAMVAQPRLVAGSLFLAQSGFTSGAGSWLVFVLLFGEHATVNPGFSLCANKIHKLNLLYVAISKVVIRVWVNFIRNKK